MLSPPLVSVIIPAFDAEDYIGEALNSALGQTHDHLEVIVVDDGSRDRTADIVHQAAAQDSRVVLLRQANGGVAAARNLGIRQARGTYIAPLDADDIWYPQKLEKQVRRMEKGGATMGMVYSWWLGIDERSAATLVTTPLVVEGRLHELLLLTNFIAASAPLFRRRALDRVGLYDSQLRARGGQGCEDWDLSLRVAEHFRVGVAPGYLVGYRMIPGSMSFDCATMAKSYELVMDKVKRRHPEISPDLCRWSRGSFMGYLANMSYAGGDYWQALRWSAKAVYRNPALLLGRWTTQLAARSLLRLLVSPLPRWFSAESEATPISREEAERNAEPVMVPWKSWKPYDRVHARRWRTIRERSAEEGAVARYSVKGRPEPTTSHL
jgi:glycosyltransferase involved in cell wall biosynthesis